MKARDVMTTTVISVAAEASVEDATNLMLTYRISGLPVTDAGEKLVGLISEGDLMRRVQDENGPRRSWWIQLFGNIDQSPEEFVKARSRRVSDVMTRQVVSVDEDTSVGEIARLIEKHRIKRVPITRDGKTVGIVSRANLLHALSVIDEKSLPTPVKDDRDLRDRVLAAVNEVPGATDYLINVTVNSGSVAVWGIADSDTEEDAIRVAVENVPGVKAVEVHMGRLPSWAYGV